MRNLMSLAIVATVCFIASPLMAQCNCGVPHAVGAPVYGAPVYNAPMMGAPAMSMPAPMMGTPVMSTPVMSAPMSYGMPMNTMATPMPAMNGGIVSEMAAPMETTMPMEAAPADSTMTESTPMETTTMDSVPMTSAPMMQGTPIMPAMQYNGGYNSYGTTNFGGSYGSVGTIFIDNDGLQGTVISDVVVEGGAAMSGDATMDSSESTEVQAGTGEATAPVPDSTTTPAAPTPDDGGSSTK